jgi:hypothetical protein
LPVRFSCQPSMYSLSYCRRTSSFTRHAVIGTVASRCLPPCSEASRCG